MNTKQFCSAYRQLRRALRMEVVDLNAARQAQCLLNRYWATGFLHLAEKCFSVHSCIVVDLTTVASPKTTRL